MKLPCEHALWYVLPQIRAELAHELIKSGLSQRQAAEKLGLTPSAVSQYLHKKRGEKTKKSPRYRQLIEKTATQIQKESKEEAIAKLICDCCRGAR
jgi:predicted transcriptional regulator